MTEPLKLTILKGHREGRDIEVPPEGAVLGRSPQMADIPIFDKSLSRIHCRIALDEEGRWSVQDMGSRNNTLVNGRRVAIAQLNPGDTIRFGETTLMVL